MKLNELHDNPGARKARMRVGRGIGSGKGKTGGRGVKGQTSRTGVSINGFEGGQMPLHRRIPKRGFTNHMRMDYVVVNLGEVQKAIDAKKLDAAAVIDAAALIASGVLRRSRDGVRLLAKGDFSTKNLRFSVIGASAPALAAVEAAGGTVELLLKSKAQPEAAA
ncbi:MAG: ribosomal protein [Rhodospirillales bacterium]|nr:ribosomal protein [Rhodospirillales bacterium]